MGEEAQGNTELAHFVYGSHEGYRMKAYSSGIDLDVHPEPFQGMFLPIKQSDVKNISEIRMILSSGANDILLSRIIKGGMDDHARETMANHTAVIPRHMLKNGEITYDEVDAAMVKFETENVDAIGDIPPLAIPHQDKSADMSQLKNYLRQDVVRNLINHYIDNVDRKVFLYYKNSNSAKRTQTAYLLSMLIDINLDLIPLKIFTDLPYGGAKRVFNLVISRVMIGVKPGGDWVMLPVEKKRSWDAVDKKELNAKLTQIFKTIYD